MYVYKHIPTQKWVKINHHLMCPEVEIYGYTTSISLVDDKDWASTHTNSNYLKQDLLIANYQNEENYGKKNFLEFELVEFS